MSAFPTVRVGDHAKHGLLLEGRHGAGDEDTGSDFAGDGKEDHDAQHKRERTSGCYETDL